MVNSKYKLIGFHSKNNNWSHQFKTLVSSLDCKIKRKEGRGEGGRDVPREEEKSEVIEFLRNQESIPVIGERKRHRVVNHKYVARILKKDYIKIHKI